MQNNTAGQTVVLDVWSHVEPRFGGIGPAASALALAVAQQSGWRMDLLAVCNRDETERSAEIPKSARVIALRGPRPLGDLTIGSSLKSGISDCDVCHVHGIWSVHSHAVRRIAQRLGKPVVSSAHGMLETWELANKRLKKQLYSQFIERPSLSRSSCLRALSLQEAADYRRFGLRNPIAVIPNGVTPIARVDTCTFLEEYPAIRGKAVVLFLGRVHKKKGILNLLASWPQVVAAKPSAHLLIAGADDGDAGGLARHFVSQEQLSNSVTFTGVLNGNRKRSALSIASAFCLPSYSEGMSIAVLEALSVGLPVILTPACNIDGIEEAGAGFLTSNEPVKLTQAIIQCLALSSNQWIMMSNAARSLSEDRFSWTATAKAMCTVYEWVLGGTKPEFVIE